MEGNRGGLGVVWREREGRGGVERGGRGEGREGGRGGAEGKRRVCLGRMPASASHQGGM